MLDPASWDLLPNGMPKAIFPHRFASAQMGGEGVLLVEYAELPEQVRTGPYKTIQIYLNRALAAHLHTIIDSTVADTPAGG
jgi:hypothetical protein